LEKKRLLYVLIFMCKLLKIKCFILKFVKRKGEKR
jgi:hypothetical protein